MTITEPMHKMLDAVTDEEKKELRALIEREAGSPYHRTLLALFRDYEEEITRLRQGVLLIFDGKPEEGRKLLEPLFVDEKPVEDAFVSRRVFDTAAYIFEELLKKQGDALREVESGRDAALEGLTLLNERVEEAERKAAALDKSRQQTELKYRRVYEWLQGYARELSDRGRLDDGTPETSVKASRDAIAVRDAAEKMRKALDLPLSALDYGTFVHDSIEKGLTDSRDLQKLLHCMGGLTLEEASEQIQKHSPWNGKDRCDHEPQDESAFFEKCRSCGCSAEDCPLICGRPGQCCAECSHSARGGAHEHEHEWDSETGETLIRCLVCGKLRDSD